MRMHPNLRHETSHAISEFVEKAASSAKGILNDKARKGARGSNYARYSKKDILEAVLELKEDLGLGSGPYKTFEAMLDILPSDSLTVDNGKPRFIYAKSATIRKKAGGIGDSTVRAHISFW